MNDSIISWLVCVALKPDCFIPEGLYCVCRYTGLQINACIMKEDKKQSKHKAKHKAKILHEDEGKRIPPAPTQSVTGGENPAGRPGQEPDVHPHEQTEGIP
jgi:hypothetical protein